MRSAEKGRRGRRAASGDGTRERAPSRCRAVFRALGRPGLTAVALLAGVLVGTAPAASTDPAAAESPALAAAAAEATAAALPPPADYVASLYFDGLDGGDGGERWFPITNSGPPPQGGPARLFNPTQDGNGDGVVDVEDALQNVVPYLIGPGSGTGRTGLADRGPNDQSPAVYVRTAPLDGEWEGWTVYQYWLYYADNDWLNHHEHDWEAYFVYFFGAQPRSVRLSFHGGFFAHDWSVFVEAGRVEDGTHLRLSVDRGSHAFQAPTAPLQDGVLIGYDGSVAARGARLDGGGDGHFPPLLVTGGGSPDHYAFGDPFYLNGERDDLRPAPWARREWTRPPPPYGFYSGDEEPEAPAQPFLDVPPDHQYAEAIAALYDAGVVRGYPAPGGALFRPEAPLLRAQLVKMVCGVLGLPAATSPGPFTDLGPDDPDDPYPHQYIAAAVQAGIVRGKTAGTFAPYEPATRGQLAAIVERALGHEWQVAAGAVTLLPPAAPEEPGDPWAAVTRGEAAAALAFTPRLTIME